MGLFRSFQASPRPSVSEGPADMPLRADDWLWLLAAAAQLLRVSFDAATTLRGCPPPYSVRGLMAVAASSGMRMGEVVFGTSGFAGLPFPVVAFVRSSADDGDATANAADAAGAEAGVPGGPAADGTGVHGSGGRAAPADPPSAPVGQGVAATATELRPVLVVRGDTGRALFFRAGSDTAEVAPLDEFLAMVEPVGLLAAAAAPALPGDPADISSPPRVFGFHWFVPEILKHRRIWIEVLAASLMIQAAGLAVPLFTQVILDKVVVHRTYSTLTVVAVGLVLFAMFSVTMSWVRQYLVIHTGTRVDAVLGAHVFRHLLRLPPAWFETRPTGTVVTRLHGVETIREFLCGAAIAVLLDIPFVLLFLCVMLWYSWQLSLLVVAVLAAMALLSAGVSPLLRARVDRQFLAGARNQAFVTEHVAGIATVKTLQAEAQVERRFEDHLAEYLEAGFATRRLASTYGTFVSALEQAMTIGVLVAGALLVIERPGFTIGMLVAFQMLASRLSQPVVRLAGLWQDAQQAAVAVRRLRDLMDCPAEPYESAPRRARGGVPAIEFRAVGFRYGPDRAWVLRGLDLHLARGDLLLVTGRSGCGKSTLAKLLLGFRWPEEGSVLVGGTDARHLSANELREHFGVVPQEPVLFSGSIHENLLRADASATLDDMVLACRAAGIHTFIEALPEGYQTRIGERGSGLSGGQKQRIAIAQALLKRARVLIFDEATSALDADTAEELAQTINRLRPQVAILFIAHHAPRTLEVTRTLRLDAPTQSSQPGNTT